jgi:phenylacetate-CoA ligase
MSVLMEIYNHLPIFFQNLAVSLEGYKLRKQRYGRHFEKYVKNLEESQWYTKEKLEETQLERLKIMIEHAYYNVPYYRELFDRIGLRPQNINTIDDLKRIPILEKQNLKERKEDFIAKNVSRRDLIPYPTGGTTGTPLTLYTTRDAIQYNFAFGEARCKHWAGVKSGDKLATFLGKPIVPADQKRPPFWRHNWAYNQLLFSSFHMSDSNLKYYVEELNRFRPEIIQGYVSTIHVIAKYILNNKKEVIPPKAILTSSETLFDWQRKDIESAFGAKVYNGYSAAEYVAFISECEKGGLHISPEYGIIEFEKIEGADEKYEIIATTLFNFAMPLIRYRTGDVVTLFEDEKNCSCGRALPLVKFIEGRMDNMLITPEGYYISPASLSLVFQSAKNIREAQIVQTKKDEIIVRIVKEENFSDGDLAYIINQLRERIGKAISIDVEFPSQIERTKAGKFRFIISEIL